MSTLRDEYFTTGEAARLLSISRSSVSRRFDSGVLWGKTNPVTGERLVHRSSLRSFLEQHGLPISPALADTRKSVLEVACADDLRSALESLSRTDSRFAVSTLEFGADALMACSSDPIDLLVLGERIPDISAPGIIRSIRRREDRDTAILCDTRNVAPEECADWGADTFLSDDSECRGTALRTIILDLLRLRDEGASIQTEGDGASHQRQWPRIPVRLHAKAGIYRLDAPRERVTGEAVVQNISQGGAFLSKLNIRDGYIPSSPFRLLLEIADAPLANMKAYCKVVRLSANGSLSAGVQFMRISRDNRNRIAAMATAS
jgi:hypothetical protein